MERTMKRGIFFTIDALIGAFILLAALLAISSYYSQAPTTVNLAYYAEDTLHSLNLLTAGEMDNATLVASLIQTEMINNTNNTLLEQIGEFWANDDLVSAWALAKNLTDILVPSNFGVAVVIDNETIYTRSSPPKTFVTKISKMVSGLEKTKPVKGFVANARATTINKQTSKTFFILPQGAGWDDSGFFQGSKRFELPLGINITNVTLYVSLHTDVVNADSAFNINGICSFDRSNFTWNFGNTEGDFATKSILGCVNPGNNT
jgi:hypothetical protein